MAARIIDRCIKLALKPDKLSSVPELSSLLNQAFDQCLRGLRFLLEFRALGLERAANSCKPALIRGRPDFLNNHPAQLYCPFYRTDISPRQVSIRRNVALRQFFEAVADLNHRYHGQNSRNGHQDDQRHGDPHDLSSNRQSDQGKMTSSKVRGTQAYPRCGGCGIGGQSSIDRD